jgi:hypothetical protein
MHPDFATSPHKAVECEDRPSKLRAPLGSIRNLALNWTDATLMR